MVELIYTDNIRGAFVAHGAGKGAMVPLEIYVRRRPLICIRLQEESTRDDITDLAVPFRVYRVIKRRLGKRFKYAMTEEHELLFSGVTGPGEGKGLRDDGSDLSSMFVEVRWLCSLCLLCLLCFLLSLSPVGWGVFGFAVCCSVQSRAHTARHCTSESKAPTHNTDN